MSIWFWISMYLLLSIYIYIGLKRWSKYKKYQWQDIMIWLLAPIFIWLYFPLALKKRQSNKLKED